MSKASDMSGRRTVWGAIEVAGGGLSGGSLVAAPNSGGGSFLGYTLANGLFGQHGGVQTMKDNLEECFLLKNRDHDSPVRDGFWVGLGLWCAGRVVRAVCPRLHRSVMSFGKEHGIAPV